MSDDKLVKRDAAIAPAAADAFASADELPAIPEDRCESLRLTTVRPSIRGYTRCALRRGHEGNHLGWMVSTGVRRDVFWTDEEAMSGAAGLVEQPDPLVPAREILEVLQAIDRGDLELTEPEGEMLVRYTTANGWGITVFNDAGDWDYIEDVTTPEGRKVDLWRYQRLTDGTNPSDFGARDIEDVWRRDPSYAEYAVIRAWQPANMKPWRWRF